MVGDQGERLVRAGIAEGDGDVGLVVVVAGMTAAGLGFEGGLVGAEELAGQADVRGQGLLQGEVDLAQLDALAVQGPDVPDWSKNNPSVPLTQSL